MALNIQNEVKKSTKTQRLLAAILGTSEARLSKIIAGKVSPTLKEANALAFELRRDVDWLFAESGPNLAVSK